MRAARLATLALLLLVTPLVASAPAMESGASASSPRGLQGFLLRPGDTPSRTFSRTPAFAWAPVRGAACYELRLATSRAFDGSSIVWSNVSSGTSAGRACAGKRAITIPATTLNVTLPWFTGQPYALYAQVRAITSRGPTGWSSPYGFNMQWPTVPTPLASKPGLVRWRPVEGATHYEVWYPEIERSLRTHTNVADLREFYSFHSDPTWWASVKWRVRAVRQVLGAIPNGLPAVSYGPWSPVYTTTNPPMTLGQLRLGAALTDVSSVSWRSASHQLMPGLTFSGLDVFGSDFLPLYRAYAFTDRSCVNVVFRGSVVGGPAFAPRLSGPSKLPRRWDELEKLQDEAIQSWPDEHARTFGAEMFALKASETLPAPETPARVDLPDVDSGTTRYYWTVVPVAIRPNPDTSELTYVDMQVPQDACAQGRVSTFAKRSKPAITASGSPYVSGLRPDGRLLTSAAARPTVYSTPLVAWRPVAGATAYEIQWSRTTYPWRAAGSLKTQSTSAVLKVGPGVWHYRVRGLNSIQVGTPAMTWSKPAAVKVVKPTFRVSRG